MRSLPRRTTEILREHVYLHHKVSSRHPDFHTKLEYSSLDELLFHRRLVYMRKKMLNMQDIDVLKRQQRLLFGFSVHTGHFKKSRQYGNYVMEAAYVFFLQTPVLFVGYITLQEVPDWCVNLDPVLVMVPVCKASTICCLNVFWPKK